LEEIAERSLLPGHTIIGDNAFVESPCMATPIPGKDVDIEEDAYNFYLSQLRITVERAFGILVHRWGILRAPLSVGVEKVPALAMCLMRLHNWCIDCSDKHSSPGSERSTERAIRKRAKSAKHAAVTLDEAGRPSSLLGGGHHFTDLERSRRPASTSCHTPMREMMVQVADRRLRRPTIKKRGSA